MRQFIWTEKSRYTLFAILFFILDWNPICISGHGQSQKQESPLQKLGSERVKLILSTYLSLFSGQCNSGFYWLWERKIFREPSRNWSGGDDEDISWSCDHESYNSSQWPVHRKQHICTLCFHIIHCAYHHLLGLAGILLHSEMSLYKCQRKIKCEYSINNSF